jgi:hypothetical protein
MAEALAYVNIIMKIIQVFDGFMAQRRNKKEQNAARILKQDARFAGGV